MKITEINTDDFRDFWPVFKTVIQDQETYTFDPELTFDQAFETWCELPLKTYVVRLESRVVGTYYLKPNAAGPSAHICNCGYMVDPQARGQGIAKQMCEHSQEVARQLGFTAMQFNSVVSTNSAAIRLWKKLGFNIIGTIPKAYQHKTLGLVDSFIMHKFL